MLFTGRVQDNNISGYSSVPSELNLAASSPLALHWSVLFFGPQFLSIEICPGFSEGLSRDELECLAEFQGACVLEEEFSVACHPYRLMADFFDPRVCERWGNPDDRAHKMFIVLEYLDHLQQSIPFVFNPSPSITPDKPIFENSGRAMATNVMCAFTNPFCCRSLRSRRA